MEPDPPPKRLKLDKDEPLSNIDFTDDSQESLECFDEPASSDESTLAPAGEHFTSDEEYEIIAGTDDEFEVLDGPETESQAGFEICERSDSESDSAERAARRWWLQGPEGPDRFLMLVEFELELALGNYGLSSEQPLPNGNGWILDEGPMLELMLDLEFYETQLLRMDLEE